MRRNWTQPGWPNFQYDSASVEPLERRFLLSSGEILGAVRHVTSEERGRLRIELLSEEAMRTSAIEGEVLDRSSVQSSLRRQFGLTADGAPSRPREQGVAEMMVDAYSNYAAPLTHDTLCRWHGMLLSHDHSLETIGAYRRHDDAMQIVSGRIDQPTVHFEAPPSAQIQGEMNTFVDWFNRTAPNGPAPLPALTRAALGHLWFESIHPFEDGNGRLGRALAEKSLAQNIGQPSLIALAYTIERDRNGYYDQLATHQRTLDVTDWLLWFAETVLKAQQVTLTRVAFFIAKAKFYDQFRNRLNDRQAKVIDRMFREGPDGFKGGLSAENYIAITGTSRATTTRDLKQLAEMGALRRTGERRHTRYWLMFGYERKEVSDHPRSGNAYFAEGGR
ncbi:cell division protein Fic [Defluviimonas sp. 20V17]|uniref:Cell division protein Fic n=1 Tax=Allgaiera indica TaxID=765699 RepID=A0AAN4UUP7_9RHOB|nr:Fic family protein [Allgaiera indica]KDB05059.1 cell division protein Fic [Defluviimonas sp. 20V17]GHE04498.1 cell division protein Fic [Allgaiera indica]SDX56768.1 Fic family protein [Allgaiera indica]